MTGRNWRDGVGRVSIILHQTDVRNTGHREKGRRDHDVSTEDAESVCGTGHG